MDNEYDEPACYERLEDYEMARITNEQLYGEIKGLKIVLLGVEGTKDTGLYGEVRDMRKLQKELNGTVKTDHGWIGAQRWMLYVLYIIVISAVTTGIMGVW